MIHIKRFIVGAAITSILFYTGYSIAAHSEQILNLLYKVFEGVFIIAALGSMYFVGKEALSDMGKKK